jgi:gamma-tubulin complex component 3
MVDPTAVSSTPQAQPARRIIPADSRSATLNVQQFHDPAAPVAKTTLYTGSTADVMQPVHAVDDHQPQFSLQSPAKTTRSTPSASRDVSRDVSRDAMPMRPAAAVPTMAAPVPPGAGAAPISEEQLLRDLVYVMLGSDKTEHAEWSQDSGRYQLRAGSVRQQNQFAKLQACGCLRRDIAQLLRRQSDSFLQQSLRRAVLRQLQHHDELIAGLRDRTPMRVGDLERAHKKALPKLRALHGILTDAASTKGGELVTKLQSLLHDGSVEMALFLRDIYEEAVSPLLNMTAQWITKGEVQDPYDEFFITKRKMDENSDNFWPSLYELRWGMLPKTFSSEQAQQILTVGKNIKFIHLCCKATDWRMLQRIATAAAAATFDSIDAVIQEALEHTNLAVMHLLRDKHHLPQMFTLARTFFLMAQGDVFDVVLERTSDALSLPVRRVNHITVQESLRSALHDCAPFLRPLVRDAIPHFALEMDVRDGNLGAADSFSIHLPFPAPVNTIFNGKVLASYRRVFHFLWKVKRAEVGLKAAWHINSNIDRRGSSRNDDVKQLKRQAVMVHMHLNHFVINLQSYLMTEVIQTAWSMLQGKLETCNCVEDILECHGEYVQRLLRHTLIDDKFRETRHVVLRLLDLALEFADVQKRVGALTELRSSDVKSVLSHYGRLHDGFYKEMLRLLTILEEDQLKFDFLQSLGGRLNFNHFYKLDGDDVQTEF